MKPRPGTHVVPASLRSLPASRPPRGPVNAQTAPARPHLLLLDEVILGLREDAQEVVACEGLKLHPDGQAALCRTTGGAAPFAELCAVNKSHA